MLVLDFEKEVVPEQIVMSYGQTYDNTIKFMEMEGGIEEEEFLKHVEVAIRFDGILYEKVPDCIQVMQKAIADAIVRLVAEKRLPII